MKPSRMLVRFAAVAVTAMSVARAAEVIVWPVNGHAYQRVDAAGITWTAARVAAEAAIHAGMRGHLVTVTSAEENRFLTEHASLGAGGADRLERHWMGGYQVAGASEPAGGWVWITGEELAFTNWAPGEPNDWPPPPGEDRLLFYQPFNSDGKQWNDAPDNFAAPALGYVIEFEPGTAPDRLRWSFQTGGQIVSCPAIGTDGTVYVGLYGGKAGGRVYALEGATGAPRWTFPVAAKDASSPALGADGGLYFVAYDRVHALDAATGKPRWEFPVGAEGTSSSVAIGADGTVYVGSCDGKVRALNGATGHQRWQFAAGGCLASSPAIGSDGTLYVGTSEGRVWALDGATGGTRWEFRSSLGVYSSPAVGTDGTVYVGSLDAKLYALTGAAGQPRWTFQTGNGVASSPAIGPDGTVYVGSEDGRLYGLVGETGQRRWDFKSGGGVTSSPAIAADGTLYVGSKDGVFYALDAATGAKRWEFKTDGGVISSPAIGADGTVYFGSHDGNLYALRGTSPLADSPWPKFRHDAQNSGRAGAGAPDLTPPTVVEVSGDATLTNLTLRFSEAVAVVTATNLANYVFTGGLQVRGATMGTDNATVILSTSAQAPQTVYTVTVNHVTDLAGNRIAPDAKAAFTAWGAQGGGQFTFGNKNLIASPPIDAKMCYWDCVTGLAGTAYWAQAYVKRANEPESSYRAVGQPVHFRTGANAGYIVSTVVTTPFPAGTAVTVQMRAWEAAFGDSYEEAQTNGGSFGKSNDVLLTVTVAPAVPPDMVGLARTCGWGFPPVPEPPDITRQPSGVRVAVDTAFSLSVSAANAAPDAYQWYRNGQPIFGENGSVVNVAKAQLTDAGDYHVTVTNFVGGATSEKARVVVGYPLNLATNGVGRIEAQPAFNAFAPGESVELTAVPGAGRTFLGWGGDASGVANPLTFAVEGPRQVVARFSLRPGDLRWQYASGASEPSTPALGADGTLYVACDISHLCALEPATGTEVWRFRTGGYISAPPTVGAGGTVLVGSWDGKVYALEGATGALKWTYQTGNTVESAPVVGVDGTVYFGCSNLVRQATITALDGALGTPKWEHATGSQGSASLALGAEGTVYARAGTNLFAIDGASGTRLWTFTAPGGMAADPALGNDGTVYAKSWEGLLYALDGLTGAPQSGWKPPLVDSSPAGPVIGFEDTLLIPGGDRVHAFSALTGATKWRFSTPDGVSATPAIAADGSVYVACGTGTVYALDSATGAEHWRFETGALLDAPLAIGPDGTVYVAAGNRTLCALQGTSGLAETSWPKFHQNAQNTGRGMGGPPEIIRQPLRSVFMEGAEGRIIVRLSGHPQPRCQWFFNDSAVPDGTNATLTLPAVTRALEGRYLLVASNALGQATSAPIVAIVSNVDPQRFPAWRWEGVGMGAGTVRAQMAPSPFGPWYEFGGFPAGATAGYYIETNLVDAVRCYRLRAEVGEARFSATAHVSGWWYEDAIGTRHRIEYAWSGGAWTNWIELTELALPASPHLFLDTDTFDHPGAVYRTTQVP